MKRDGWMSITQVLATECPQMQGQGKDFLQTKKKYHNLKKFCLKDVKNYEGMAQVILIKFMNIAKLLL